MIKRTWLWSWAPLPVGEKYILTLEVSVFLMFSLACETCTPVIRTIGLQWQTLQALRAEVFIVALTVQQPSCNSTTHTNSFFSILNLGWNVNNNIFSNYMRCYKFYNMQCLFVTCHTDIGQCFYFNNMPLEHKPLLLNKSCSCNYLNAEILLGKSVHNRIAG